MSLLSAAGLGSSDLQGVQPTRGVWPPAAYGFNHICDGEHIILVPT